VIFRAFLLSLGQIGDRRFLRVLGRGVLLSLALLGGVYAGFVALLDWATPETLNLPLVGEVAWVHNLIGWGSLLLMIGLSVFLMVPAAAMFSGFFLDEVAAAVEARHYPGLPGTPRVPLFDSAVGAVNLFGVLVAVNALALLLYGLVGPFAPLMFWAVNGYLLGREYFEMAAARRLGTAGAKALRKANAGTAWLAGCLMAAPLSLPVLNLLIPVLGAATFTHLVHMLAARGR
jgi:uncharacterized protein involved in cysteine biosynthesis